MVTYGDARSKGVGVKRTLSVILTLILATTGPLTARATDASLPVRVLLNKDLQEVRRALVGDLPSGDREARSVFEAAGVHIEAFDRLDLIQIPGCQAYVWPDEGAP